jgi:phosphoserine phosphatase
MRWRRFQHVFFDCDSTLTTVEGIDVLAENAGKGDHIKTLTNAAMDGEIDLKDVYGKRLELINPTRREIREIRQAYKNNIVEDAQELIAALQYLGHNVYIISGGLLDPVREFGIYLGVPAENIRAVGVQYNGLSGDWWLDNSVADKTTTNSYLQYKQGALTVSDGKAQIVRELLGEQKGHALLVGDGNSDYHASPAVDLFVGFGGVVTRDQVLQDAPVFIHSPSIAPLLPLAAGPIAHHQLKGTTHEPLSLKANQLISNTERWQLASKNHQDGGVPFNSTGVITFQNDELKTKFNRAYQAVYSGSR